MPHSYQRPVFLISALLLFVVLLSLGLSLGIELKSSPLMLFHLLALLLVTLAACSLCYWRPRADQFPVAPPLSSLQRAPSLQPEFVTDHAQNYLDQAHTLLLVLDTQGQVVYLNQHGYRLLGYPQGSLDRGNWLQLCVPSEHHREIIKALSQHRNDVALAPMFIEHPVLTAEGQQLLIAWNCSSIKLDNGSRQLLCAGRDMTDNRKIQERLHKLSCAVEQSATAVMIFDRSGLIEYVNPAFTALTGYHASEVTGRKPKFLESGDTDKATLNQLRRTICKGDNWHGEIAYRKKSGELFWARERISAIKDDQAQISHYVSICEDITLERQHQTQIERLAYQDQLTSLPNRRAFLQQLQNRLVICHKQQRTLTLFYLNLDHFKRVNNSLGQSAGDQLLCQIATLLRREICAQDLIARHSSDEFLLALHDLNETQMTEFARRINRLVRNPITLFSGTNSIQSKLLTTSIGIACFPKDSTDANELIKFADLAMHRVKQADRNGYRFFSQTMHDELEAELFLEHELQQAIKNNEFVLYYQPQIDLNSLRVTGLEALVRWDHPQRGMIPPDQFIALAERSGLIIALGELVLRKACLGYQVLDNLGLGRLRIAINLSALQFRDPLFLRTFEKTLHEFKVKPSQIELELTESMLMTNIEDAISILTQLKQLGSTLAIDDFGTGYSSLSYLKRLPVDIIKVDRSFVQDIPQDQNDMEITAAVIAMAHKLKRQVVAEGVETPAQEQFLRDNECEYVQGYLYSKPVPEAELLATIEHIDHQLCRASHNCVQLDTDAGHSG